MHSQDPTSNFPPGTSVPELLIEFSEWFRQHPYPEEWAFQIQSEKVGSDWFAINGADLYDSVMPFIQLPRGSRVCLWRQNQEPLNECPVLYFHSDGDDRIVGKNLESFLVLFAAGKTGIQEIDSTKNETVNKIRTEFHSWLHNKSSNAADPDFAKLEADCNELTTHLVKWLDDWNQQQDALIKENESFGTLVAKLKHYLAVNAQPWEKTNFEIAMVGPKFEIRRKFFGDKEVPEAADIEPILRELRVQRAGKCPGRGLWHSAWLSLSPEGGVSLDCEFLSDPEPLFQKEKPTEHDYKADCQSHPREQYWQPHWLAGKIETAGSSAR